MKLGLLLVAAVAVLLPSFSESRIVSKCELRDKLREMIQLPARLQEGILATVICEVDRRSHLNSSLVSVFGNRIPTTPKPTVTTAPPTTGADNMTTAAPVQPTSTSSTTTQLTNTTATTTTTSNTTTSPATAMSTTSSMNTTVVSNSTGGGKRRKREVHSSSEGKKFNKEENKFNEEGNKFNEKENKFNEKENKFNEEGNKFNEEGMVHYGSQMEDEDETSTEDDPGSIRRPWSLALYGLFQLSDKHFCDSGYRWSRNACCSSCAAFADDDITDDIACVVNTDYWREILGSASHSCRHASDFFKECN